MLGVSFWDNAFLDEYTLPIGDWARDATNWLVTELGWLWDAIKWPPDQMLNLVIDEILLGVPWIVVVLATVVLGWRLRNLTIGVLSGLGLVVCGLLGDNYWAATMQTLGMIIVAVTFCVVVGIPLGILAARRDSAESVIRPILDAMQTIHPFVYLLPIVFLFGIRRTPGTMATVIFALPPIVRLTNLGIRQVPKEVVEAARSFGTTERQLLRDVQLPLARPTIMAGLNQTLMLALSMVVIAALLSAGGLGQLILGGVQRSNIPQATSSGLAVLILAVILDRLSQGKRVPSSTGRE